MSLDLTKVVPSARSLDEYRLMFDLREDVAHRRILGVGDGLSNFNARGTTLGWRVVSVDPLYEFDGVSLHARFEQVVSGTIQRVATVPGHWVWTLHAGPDALEVYRREVAGEFLRDYEAGRAAGRYVNAALPHLPFPDHAFDLVLCSHLLFSWAELLDRDFHLASIAEMLRVGREIRICPTSNSLQGERSLFVDDVSTAAELKGRRVITEWFGVGTYSGNTERMIVV